MGRAEQTPEGSDPEFKVPRVSKQPGRGRRDGRPCTTAPRQSGRLCSRVGRPCRASLADCPGSREHASLKGLSFLYSPRGTHPSQGQDLKSRMAMGGSVAMVGNQKTPYFKAVMGEAGIVLDQLPSSDMTAGPPPPLHPDFPPPWNGSVSSAPSPSLDVAWPGGGCGEGPGSFLSGTLTPAHCALMDSSPRAWEQGSLCRHTSLSPRLAPAAAGFSREATPLTGCLTPAQSRPPEGGTVR